ncbi:hypothetical protein R1sor_011075 [Riccia sorocarpa]|uniref:Uncharacterized protein n=1 Tax=Riccia sorocarpa TaxID=122646 RepID=A0ABD3I1P4_9MARC
MLSDRGDISSDEKEEQARDPNLLQYKDRNNWKGKGVRIFRKGAAEEEIAKGRIIFPSSSASVAGVLVGEENARIIVLEVSDSVDPLVLQQELPNFTSGQPYLCRWPICSLRIEENGEILGDLYSAYEDADFVRKTQHPQAGPRKRPYFSTKRKLKTQEEKLSDRLKRKAEQKLLDADISKDMIKGCSCGQRLTSIAKYLRDCEDFDGDMRGDLAFEKELEHPLLNAFMNKDIFSKTVVGADSLLRRETSSSESGLLDKPFNKLPPTFYIQLDNSDRKSKTDFSVVPPPDQELLSSGMASNHAATEDIVTYLKAYIKHIKSIRDKTNPSSKCYETDSSIILYWENIKSLFEKPKGWATNAGLPLKEGFWPRTNHGTGYKRPGNQIILTSTPEDDILAQEAEE